MSTTNPRGIAAGATILASLVLGGPAFAEAGGCHSYGGTFTAVRPDVCLSPVGICTQGTLAGSVLETYDFVAGTLVFTGPNTADYSGHSLVRTRQGAEILGSDSGSLTIRPDGVIADFVTTVQVVGGTRQYAGASGEIVAPGVLNLVTGATEGSYAATICLGRGDAGQK